MPGTELLPFCDYCLFVTDSIYVGIPPIARIVIEPYCGFMSREAKRDARDLHLLLQFIYQNLATETVEQVLKTSLPNYGPPKTFLQNIGQTVRAAEKLFEAATDTDQDKQAKEDQRQKVFGWLAETKTSVYDL